MEYACTCINKVTCIDREGDMLSLCPTSFYENMDEIIIGTQIINTDLERGWQGDIMYEAPAYDIKTDNYSYSIQDHYQGVILIKIRPSWRQAECVEWEYVFSKY